MIKLNKRYRPFGRAFFAVTLLNLLCVNLSFGQNNTQNDAVPNVVLDFPLQNHAEPNVLNTKNLSLGSLTLHARLTDDGQDLTKGLVWRIFKPEMGEDNKLPLVASSKGGAAYFSLKPGKYLIHASFGQAAVMQQINVTNGQEISENLVLDAGGVKLNAIMPEGKINNSNLSFKIYADDSENDDTALILANVAPDSVTRLKAGNYHIVSNYGAANAISRSDIRVDAGKITEVTMQHHAAQITLKLVRQEGGEALADTSWSVTTDSGDIVLEMVGAYASLVLTEGDYVAIAKNKDQIYQKVFSVSSGHDENIDVVADTQNMQPFGDDLD